MIITEKGIVVYYGRGKFDNFCVHVLKPKFKKIWYPKDYEYFKWLRKMGKRYGNEEIYNDFLKIYEPITKDTEIWEIEDIVKEVSDKYKNSKEWWIILVLTIKAEEHKKNTILGKRIKCLGAYFLLMENKSIGYSVNFMKGKPWYVLDEMMVERSI